MSYSEFDSTAVTSAIKKIASCSGLTLVVGAGASVESGLPTWKTLVNELLITAAANLGLAENDQERFSQWTRSSEDLTGSGEIARQLLDDKFRRALYSALYGRVSELTPGETARAISSLRLERSAKSNEIVTTNYDLLLEQAIREELRSRGISDLQVERVTDNRRVSPSTIAVRHVHGSLSKGDQRAGKLVLSDRDYYLMQHADSWQEGFFKTQLNTSTSLFVGTSLTDPNLLRYIYRSGHSRRHYAVFVRQDEYSRYDDEGEQVVQLREESQAVKWRAVHVEPILFDHYAQSAQFIWEIAAACRNSSYKPLPQRLADWQDQLKAILPTGGRDFIDTQNRLQRFMAGLLNGTKKLLNRENHRLRPGEKLGVSLWVFDPKRSSLVNWASADRVWRDPRTLEPIPVHWSSDFIAAKAFCAGSMVSQSTQKHVVSRWNHVIGFPIYLHKNEGRLPIGAVTLASTEEIDRSFLNRGAETIRASAIPSIEGDVSQLLDPDQVSA